MKAKYYLIALLCSVPAIPTAAETGYRVPAMPSGSAKEIPRMLKEAFKFIEWKKLPANLKKSYHFSRKKNKYRMNKTDAFVFSMSKLLVIDKYDDPKKLHLPITKGQFDYLKEGFLEIFPYELKRAQVPPFFIEKIGYIFPSVGIVLTWFLNCYYKKYTILAVIVTLLLVGLMLTELVFTIIRMCFRVLLAAMKSRDRFAEKMQQQHASLNAIQNLKT